MYTLHGSGIMIVDRKKYRWYDTLVTGILILFIVTVFIVMIGNFYLSLAAVIIAPIIHYIFKRWAKAEDERVLMISGKATRRTLQVFCIGIVILALFLFYFKPNLFSMELTEINKPTDEKTFAALVWITPDDVSISPMENNWSIVFPDPGGNITIPVKNFTTGNISFSEMTINLNGPKPADIFGIAFLISVVSLWMLYAVFYNYYSWKYGDFEG
jgi:uncharacterized membrane protein